MTARTLKECSLLLVDDEEANLDLLEGLLVADGYRNIAVVSDARRAVSTFEERRPDLVLLDLHMPFVTGYQVLEQIRARVNPEDYLPVLVLTADVTTEARDRALTMGARDFLTKPFDAVEVLLRVRNLLETRLLHRAQAEARVMAEQAERRSRLLADASRLLSASLDSETGLTQVSRLLVPEFAGSAQFVLPEGDRYRTVAVSGPDLCRGKLNLTTEPLASALASSEAKRIEAGESEVVVVPMCSPSRRVGTLLATPAPGKNRVSEVELSTLCDLAGRVALALENARLFADAQAATRARERLLSVVAHDLRNPLAVIAMYAEMLLDLLPTQGEEEGKGETDEYAAEALLSIYKSAHRMQEQIESLLDYSRVQQGTLVVEPTPSAVEDLFAEAELLLRPLAEARSIELKIERRGEPKHDTVRLDSGRIQQVLSNLVGNAVKFTPEGGRVTIRWSIDDQDLNVSVEDTGPGIPAEQIPHVFGAYWQAGHGDRRGMGLGLWIARAIVDGHGGRIWVDSAEGRGAAFHFSIPAVPGDAGDDRRAPGTTNAGAEGAGDRVAAPEAGTVADETATPGERADPAAEQTDSSSGGLGKLTHEPVSFVP